MTIELNTKCPCYNWVNAEHFQCDTCDCCEGFSPDDKEVYCNYSQVPNVEPDFKKGDMAYRITHCCGMHSGWVQKEKVRNAVWQRNHWEYQFGREQHCYPGYKTEKDAYAVLCKEEVKLLKQDVERFKQNIAKSGLSLEDFKETLLIGE